MKDLRDLKDLTVHDVRPIGDESTTGRRNSLRDSTEKQRVPGVRRRVCGGVPRGSGELGLLERRVVGRLHLAGGGEVPRP